LHRITICSSKVLISLREMNLSTLRVRLFLPPFAEFISRSEMSTFGTKVLLTLRVRSFFAPSG
jgi:hypothetical protein